MWSLKCVVGSKATELSLGASIDQVDASTPHIEVQHN